MPVLLIASTNPGKLREIQSILRTANLVDDLRLELVLPSQMGIDLDVVEDGQTYRENASKKAAAFAKDSGLVSLADDSGLEVEALGGEPGLRSHRYAPWPDATDADRRRYLLEVLKDKPRPWPARFHCTVAIAAPGGALFFSEGDCPGEIIPEERGAGGFGYDPIFYLPEFGQTMAQLSEDQKNRVSHRARALQAAIPQMRGLFK